MANFDFGMYKEKYLNTLTKEIIPYWLKHAIDESGAINNCLDEDGTIISKERYIWSQGRALWTFSALYNRIEKKKEYLDVADGLFNYLVNTGRDKDGKWLYRFDEKGNILDEDISIYVDGFVLIGMTEYYKATGNELAKKIALETHDNVLERLNRPGSYKIAPYAIPEGMKTHGVNMIFSYFFYEMGKAFGRKDICDEGYELALEIINKFYKEDRGYLVEFINVDGSFTDCAEQRVCVPGHVIECMWFLITIFEDRNEQDNILKCCKIIKEHINHGLDKEKGGLILAFDIEGIEPCFWNKPTYKPWWVQLETMVSTLYAYKYTNDEWFLDMHEQVSEFAYKYYPNGYGEWINWLDKDCNVGGTAALPVKDPFHLPRALIVMIDLCEKLSK